MQAETKIEEKNIKKFTLTTLLAYFIIYSVVGFVIETIFGLLTKGVLESRKSFILGPFCSIYGLGAVVMIVALQKFNKNNYTLFLGGFLVGSIIEYLISLIGEALFHMVWWDYSDMAFNINGRICIAYSMFWGILAIYLMKHFNPKVDKYVGKYEKMPMKELADKVFSNKLMLRTFPNLKITNKDGNIVLIRDVLSDIKPYYLKIFTPKTIDKVGATE